MQCFKNYDNSNGKEKKENTNIYWLMDGGAQLAKLFMADSNLS